MKDPVTKFLALISISWGLLVGAEAQTTITFDALSPGNDWIVIPNGYGNLNWSNFGAYNGENRPITEGYRTGVVSPNNVAFNLSGTPASIQSSSKFDLVSAYLTSQSVNDLQLHVFGYQGANLVYSNSYTLSPSGPEFIQFNYIGVDRVSFSTTPESWFVLDDLTILPQTTGASCSFAIAPADGVHGYGNETGAVSVATSESCIWSVSNDIPWVTILSPTANVGSWTVSYLVQSNATGLPRSGFIQIAGQLFAVSQSPFQPLNVAPVDLGKIVVTNLGHELFTNPPGPGLPRPSFVSDYLIDQDEESGGGASLPTATIDWNTNRQFVTTVSAPVGHKFLIQVPSGQSAKFSGFLWWESAGRGGSSPPGSVKVDLIGLEGMSPDFSQSSTALSDSHGYFGVGNLDSAPFTANLAFSSIIITGTIAPQYATGGALLFTPHNYSFLKVVCTTSGGGDPGPFVSIVPQNLTVQSYAIAIPMLNSEFGTNGDLTITFNGALQSANDPRGPFKDVLGNPLGVFTIPRADQGAQQFFRARGN